MESKYLDPKYGFINKDKFRKKFNLPTKEANSIVENNASYQIHSQAKQHYLHITPESGVFQADIMFFPDSYKRFNSNFNSILNIIEIGTRYMFSYALKSKNESEMLAVMKTFLNDIRLNKKRIERLESDGGPEFTNKSVQALLRNNDIEFTLINPHDNHKKAIIERFNQTQRNIIERYLTATGKKRWVDVLDDLTYNYNHTIHRTLNIEPANVTKTKEEEIRTKLKTDDENLKALKQYRRLKEGDFVRVLIRRGEFQKGRRKWSVDVHTIVNKVPNTFQFNISNGDVYKYDELQRVPKGSKNAVNDTEFEEEERVVRHSRRLNREDIFDNIREARQHIDREKETEPKAQEIVTNGALPAKRGETGGNGEGKTTFTEPVRRSTRVRNAPDRLRY